MKNLIILFLTLCVALGTQDSYAQADWSQSEISDRIEDINFEERAQLKRKVRKINKRFDNNEITEEEAIRLKEDAALYHAQNINDRVEALKREHDSNYRRENIEDDMFPNDEEEVVPSYSDDDDDDDSKESSKEKETSIIIRYGGSDKDDDEYTDDNQTIINSRTNKALVIGFGVNNVLRNQDFKTIEDSNYGISESRFVELGANYKTRLFYSSNVLNVNFGFAFQWSNLRLNDNQFFVRDGDQTFLEINELELDKASLRSLKFIVPFGLEVDLSERRLTRNGVRYNTGNGFRLGVGAFGGIKVHTKQLLVFKEENRDDKEKHSFNTNQFLYGVSAQVGYGSFLVYGRYSLNTVFKDNPIEENNITLGIKFEIW